jgi:ribose transport system permease protein
MSFPGKYGARLKPLLSFAGLLALLAVYLFKLNFNPTPLHIQTIINQVTVMAVMATGAVFIYSLGSFDISLGNAAGVAVCLGIMAYNAGAGVAGMFVVCVGVGLVTGLVNSVLSAIFRIPVFVMTLAMMTVLTAILQLLMGGRTNLPITREINAPVKALDDVGFRIIVMLAFFALCVVLFNFTKIGRHNKMLGGNPTAAAQTGISTGKQTIITFLISGSAVGISSFLLITRSLSVSNQTGTSLGLDVMMSIVFGGMPLSGGSWSRISAGMTGAFSMVLMSQILTMYSVSTGMSQVYKAALFLAVVFVASLNYRAKMLSKAEMF